MRADRPSPRAAWLALTLVAFAAPGCRPRLPADLVTQHTPTPRAAPVALVAASAPRRPGWLQGGRGAQGSIFVGQASAADLDEAMAAAERDLARQVAQALGVELDARFVSKSAEGPDGAEDSAHGAVRLRDGARAVTPDARYWERLEGEGRVQHRAFVRLEVATSELLRAQSMRRARDRAGAERMQVVLRFEGPRASAMERQVFFSTAGAARFEVVDPALVEASGARTPAALQAALTPGRIVRGTIYASKERARSSTRPALAMHLEVVGGAQTNLAARSWAQLAEVLPVALRALLFGPRGPPTPRDAPASPGEGGS